MLNEGSLIADYSLPALMSRVTSSSRVVLPVCSIGTPTSLIAGLGEWVLPPLYREAMDDVLRAAMLERIGQCFPYHVLSSRRRSCDLKVEVVEVSRGEAAGPAKREPAALAFSVDTAVEEHGPHLPLSTDRIQSYAVLERVAAEREGMLIAPPADYGQLTWGLGPVMTIDLTAPLTTAYVTGYVNAMLDWAAPKAVYVVDVHGSLIHRQAVRAGIEASKAKRWAFRWLHEPIASMTWERKDAHAGGAETMLIETIDPAWVDGSWWPGAVEELAADQISLDDALKLGGDVAGFIERAETRGWNGIVGDVRTYFDLDGGAMMKVMVDQAIADVDELLR